PAAAPGGKACAVHFSEPSCQKASGQLCRASSPPLASRSAKVPADRSLPRAHGVPQVTPCAMGGALPSSQRTQLPVAGFAPFEAGGGCDGAGVSMASTALVAAPVERKARREIRLPIAFPQPD